MLDSPQPRFVKWPSVNKFSDTYRAVGRKGIRKEEFLSKIKLHGTNAGIIVHDGKCTPQKRSNVCGSDRHMGFTEFVSKLKVKSAPFSQIVFFGEWAGPGVQKKDAVTLIPEKTFFLFAVLVGDEVTYDPDTIRSLSIMVFGKNERIITLPIYSRRVVNFLDQEDLDSFVEETNKEVEKIGNLDPYIKETFGIEGPGEGLVFAPRVFQYGSENDLMFKVKCAGHSVNKSSKMRSKTVTPQAVKDFHEEFVTENRLRQMFDELTSEMGVELTNRHTGKFIGKVMQDVVKESGAEREGAEYTTKDITKYSTPHVRNWFLAEVEKIGN